MRCSFFENDWKVRVLSSFALKYKSVIINSRIDFANVNIDLISNIDADLKFNFKMLSSNTQVTPEFVSHYSDSDWDFEILTNNSKISCKSMEPYPSLI